MEIVREIHKYQQYYFHYAVARINKYCETKVKDEVEYTYGPLLKVTYAGWVFIVTILHTANNGVSKA
jgi:hypothetical protein